jgi:uncharacterized membrane protein HdeD (DUF308 family)
MRANSRPLAITLIVLGILALVGGIVTTFSTSSYYLLFTALAGVLILIRGITMLTSKKNTPTDTQR